MLHKNTARGFLYAIIHFSVEVASFYFLFSRISASPLWWALALLFDAAAFLPQGIIGTVTDRYPKYNIGLTGAVTMLLGLVTPADIPALCLIALGNAMIHVSGANHTLRDSGGKITPNAIFVGGGSFGVITGQLLGGIGRDWLLLIPIGLLLLSAVTMVVIQKTNPSADKPASLDICADKSDGVVVFCTFFAVAVRGYIAYAIPTEWNKTVIQTVALFVCMGIGKMLGGILCDRIGFRRVTAISLLGSLPFLLAGNTNMALSLTGVALFSMTMSVTVAILVSRFPHQPGFAFGITTTGLFFGTVPAFFVRPQTLPAHQIAVLVLSAAALPAIITCIKKGK
ncbi:MAG: MFS transporter [Ruminococcaceae bacterium]|nr:MFS transporter [Oscillospiraceae bacterium]